MTAQEPAVLASRAWPKVSGVSRDEGHSRALLVFFAAEPTDDEVRAVHDTLAAQPAPLSDEVVKDAARWRMVALIGNEVMLHPEKRTHATAVKAYMDATHSGSDLTGAVDAAIAAQGGSNAE